MFWNKKKDKKAETKSPIIAELEKEVEVLEHTESPRAYVIAKEFIDGDDAQEILRDAAERNNDYRFLAGRETMFTYIDPEKATITKLVSLKQSMGAFFRTYGGKEYMDDDYELLEYYHPAEGEAPRANKDKEYCIIVPIREK
jgi:nuclear transport factor 2 (NTF2) superfamily protein